MLDENDLLAIAKLVDTKLDAQLTPIRETLEELSLQMENMVDPYHQELLSSLQSLVERLDK